MNTQKIFEEYYSMIFGGEKKLLPIDNKLTVILICVVDDFSFESSIKFSEFFAQALENDCDIVFFDENIKDIDIEYIDKSIFSDTLIILFDFIEKQDFPAQIAKYLEKKSITNKIIYITQNKERSQHHNLKIVIRNLDIESLAAVAMHLAGRKPLK